jgi:excisionase family DNA binding protein
MAPASSWRIVRARALFCEVVMETVARRIVVDQLYTLGETAEYLRVSASTVLREVRRGRLRALKIQRQWRFLGSDIQRYLETVATDARGA